MNNLHHISFDYPCAPERFTYPFAYTPHPWARQAAEQVMQEVRAYMAAHPESELHRQGKMFGVLVVEGGYLSAFSAKLDGTYFHPGFVPPVVDLSHPDGYFKQEEARISAMQAGPERKARSQALQRWLFSEYKMLNGVGQTKNLLELFRDEKPILTEEEFFSKKQRQESLPPAASGECCAPKLMQYAYQNDLRPLCMAEFWMGASPASEVREEGRFYPACQSRCRPILRHMLQGLELDPNPLKEQAEALLNEVKILFEDGALVVVNKPAGLLSAPGSDPDLPSILNFPFSIFNSQFSISPVHRLDQDTSGILVIAKTPEVYKRLQQQFLRRDVHKRYEALLERVPQTPAEGLIDLPLLPDPFDRPRQMVNMAHGKPALTRYELRERRSDGTCLVDFFPATGRTHQLRVHAAHHAGLNAPILGDRLYGTPSRRLYLHAAEITFTHPLSGAPVHILCPSNF